jgi:hypothetical protein
LEKAKWQRAAADTAIEKRPTEKENAVIGKIGTSV